MKSYFKRLLKSLSIFVDKTINSESPITQNLTPTTTGVGAVVDETKKVIILSGGSAGYKIKLPEASKVFIGQAFYLHNKSGKAYKLTTNGQDNISTDFTIADTIIVKIISLGNYSKEDGSIYTKYLVTIADFAKAVTE